jgi:uncharacterized protein (TIGR03437 family)
MKLGLVTFACALLASAQVRTTPIASGISAPTDIQNAGDGSGRLFLVQQNGIVRVLRNGSLLPDPFLDIRSRTAGNSERGLLGLAFPPGFEQKQRFYVDYTDRNGNTVIAMYRVTSNPNVADAGSEAVLLNITQPFANHNGGQIRFGPDGYLYIAMGDGGGAGDPQGNGQRLDTLLGKLLRIDVESEPGRVHIPPGNPFVRTPGARPEIWAFGLRNPWRFSFDRVTRDLWIADVGQDTYEEVDLQRSFSQGGENYGWNQMEGFHCFRENCSMTGLALPVTEYNHSLGCSITGGFVYRGALYPSLRGTYIYGDYCSGTIWGYPGSVLLQTGFAITTFGEDEAGEIYVANANNGSIYHIEGSTAPIVVNAASFRTGVAPGSLATVFTTGLLPQPGIVAADRLPLPYTLGGVSAAVNGIPAPVLSIASVNGVDQVNFQIPFEARGGSANIGITRGTQTVNMQAFVAQGPYQPGIFTSDGSSAIVVHNADYTLVTPEHPLERGEYAFLYATGLPPPLSPPATGAAAPIPPLSSPPVQVLLGSTDTEVQFTGLAPGFAGVYQINFRVGQSVASGMQELRLRESGVATPPVFVPVR